MEAEARAEEGGGARRPPEGGPRFALRFEDGRGRLQLARPFRFAFGRVEHLVLDLGRLAFPLDLSAGPGRFRTRRTRVREAKVRVDVPSVLAALARDPYAARPLSPVEGGLAFALRDAFGTVAFETRATFEGSTLRVAPLDARAATEGPAPPLARVMVAARALGLELEVDRGALSAPRALGALLMEALVPHGWRVPDDRGVRLRLEVLGPRRVSIETLPESAPEPAPDPAWERARRLAPVVAALAIGDRERAERVWADLRERHREDALQLAGASLGLEPAPASAEGPVGRALALRDALRDGDLEAASGHARALAEVEPCDAVAVEALCAVADRALDARPRLAASLLERAAGRRPTDAELALRLVGALARLGDEEALEDALEDALAAREPGPERGALAREAARLLSLAGRDPAAARAWAVAASHLPHDADVLLGLARVRAAAGEPVEALALFDRAASALRQEGDAEGEAAALAGGARAAERAGRVPDAEDRLSRAAALTPRDAGVLASLAAARRTLDAAAPLRRAEDRLLAAMELLPVGGASSPVRRALGAAAEDALEASDLGRARAFHAARERVAPDDEAAAALAPRIEELELGRFEDQPERLLTLPPDKIVRALAKAEDAAALAREARAQADDEVAAARALATAAGDADETVAGAIADVLVRDAERLDGDASRRLADLAPDEEARLAYLRAASRRLKEEGRPGEAALALAEVGAAKRDTAMLRAALTAAERAGEVEAARRIVALALEVVGDGPARSALEAMRDRLAGS
ncbi:MAG: hypothetical protein VYE22_34785 [Myxococcota bacterium]|nr:hypothetical protein [Myxococcota bacterium]